MMSEKSKQIFKNIHFTTREWDVLACLSVGCVTSKDIARRLQTSPKTIETHISHILTKAACNSRHHVTAFIRESGSQKELQEFYLKKFGSSLEGYSSFKNLIRVYHSLRRTRFGTNLMIACACLLVGFAFFRYVNHAPQHALLQTSPSHLLPREDLMERLNKGLNQSNTPIIALVGQGGAGKTTLAREYIRTHPSALTFEINAENNSTLLASFMDLADHLGHILNQADAVKELNAVSDDHTRTERLIRFVYQNMNTQSSWLLLFENVNDIAVCRDYLPPSLAPKGRIILTTRDQNIEQCSFVTNVIHIGELTPEESFKLLKSLLNPQEHPELPTYEPQELQEFLRKIPLFPLDISLAAHYIRSARLSFDQYLERMTSHQPTFHQHERNLWKQISDYPQTRYAILALSISKLIECNAEYEKLLWVLAYINCQDIPVDLIKQVVEPALVDSFMHDLRRFSLVSSKSDNQASYSFSIHNSTQAILKQYLITRYGNPNTENIGVALIRCAEKAIQENKALTIHKLVAHFDQVKNLNIPDSLKDIFSRTHGFLCYHAAQYSQAKELLEVSLNREKQKQKPNNEVLLKLYVGLGSVYKEIMETENAKKIFEAGLDICQQHFSSDTDKRILLLGNVAHIYRRLGDYKKTELLCTQCLDLYEKSNEKNASGRVKILEALCDACREQGMFERAASYATQTIDACRQNSKYCPIQYAHAINLLAHVRCDQGLYQEAITLYEQTLDVYKKNLPAENTKIIKIYLKLSSLYRRTGNINRAIEFLNKASSTNLIVMAMSAYERAYIAVEQNNYKKAFDWGWKSYVLYTQIYGEQHIKTMRSLCLLGYIEFLDDHLDKAETHLKQALQTLGHQQNYLRYQALAHLSKVYRQKARQSTLAQAQVFLQQSSYYAQEALDVAQKYFPPDSAHIANLKKSD